MASASQVAETRCTEPEAATAMRRQAETSAHLEANPAPKRHFSRLPTAVRRKRKRRAPMRPPTTVMTGVEAIAGFRICIVENVSTESTVDTRKLALSFSGIALPSLFKVHNSRVFNI